MKTKLPILLFLLILVFAGCKRTTDAAEYDGMLAMGPAHCYNQTTDTALGEVGYNCGGPCPACNIASPTCSPTNNTFTFNGNTYTVSNQSGVSGATYSGYYDFTATASNGMTILVRLMGTTPDMSIGHSSQSSQATFSNGQAFVQIYSGSYGNMDDGAGTVFVSTTAGKYTVTLCSGSVYSWVTGQSYPVSFKFTLP